MTLLGFLATALPWFSKKIFSKDKTLIGKFEDLVERIGGNKTAYNKILNDAQKLAVFQQHALAMQRLICDDRKNARNRDEKIARNYRADLMILTASVALFSCLSVLIFNKNQLSAELISMMTICMTIFGSCLKKAYVFEFGETLSNQANMYSDNDNIFTMNSTASGCMK